MRKREIGVVVLIVGVLAAILWDPIVDPFLNRERYRGEVRTLYDNLKLEMTKEQLESTNEELVTLNETMQNRNVELDQTNRQLAVVSSFSDSIIKTMRQPLLMSLPLTCPASSR